MILKVKNTTSDNFVFVNNSVSVPAETEVEISSSFWFDLFFDLGFLENIRNRNFIVSNGVQILTPEEGLKYIKDLNANSMGNRDADGALIVRHKAAKKGWTFCAIPIEFQTSQIGSLYSKLVDGSNRPGLTLKFYNQQGQEITEEGLLEANENTVIRTVLDFEPNFDYEVIGGNLRIEQDINSPQNCRLWIIALPDVPAQLGGSKEMAGGVNLRFLAPQNSFNVDGRVAKYLPYNASLHTNKLRFILEHTAGLKVWIHLTLEIYKP